MCTLLCPHGLENQDSFCVCVKRRALCNCLCSSSLSSPRHSSVLSGISGNSEQKTILQTTEQPIQFRVFRDSVPVLKIHGCN